MPKRVVVVVERRDEVVNCSVADLAGALTPAENEGENALTLVELIQSIALRRVRRIFIILGPVVRFYRGRMGKACSLLCMVVSIRFVVTNKCGSWMLLSCFVRMRDGERQSLAPDIYQEKQSMLLLFL